MSKKILLSILVIVVAIGLVGVGTYALWSDSAATTGNEFKTGVFDVAITSPTSLPISVGDMYPGGQATYEFAVKNTSSVDVPTLLTMTGTWGGGGGLGDHLKADIYYDGAPVATGVPIMGGGTLPLGPLAKDAEKAVKIVITMDAAVSGTDHMGATVTGDITFTLNQQ